MARTERYTAQQVIQAIQDTGGIKDKIARNLGCHRHTVDNYIERYPTVARAYKAEREKVLDLAESRLFKKLEDGFWPAIRYYLSTLGKDRGYVQRQEIDEIGDLRIKVNWGDEDVPGGPAEAPRRATRGEDEQRQVQSSGGGEALGED